MTGRESTMKQGILNKAWEETQIKVFSRWCAKHLRVRNIPFETLRTEFSNGVKLINLLEIIGGEKMDGRWHANPKNRFQMLENCQLAIHYITEIKKIKLIGIHPEDIVDCNLKLTLGLIWSCILKFVIEDISVEEATARDALLIWCKKNTQGYEDVNITNFTTSWSSGLGFCALINHFRPDVLDYNALDRSDHTANCVAAFDACKKLGITVFLDPEDLVNTTPDDKSVVTQVSEFFHFFAGQSKTQQSADKIRNTIAIQKILEDLLSNYEKQAQDTIDAINTEKTNITDTSYEKTVPGTKAKLVDVVKYGRVGRPHIVELRGTALSTWANLVTNCRSNSRPIPKPKEGLDVESLDNAFNDLEETQAQTRARVTQELHDLEDALLKEFDEKCQAITSQANDIKERSGSLNGSLKEQGETLQSLLSEANELLPNVETLQEPYDELTSLNLSQKTNNTPYSVRNTVEQVISHLNRLIDQNNAAIIEEENQAKIAAYNAKAQKYVDEEKALEQSLSEIQGSTDERRDAWLNKQEEITQKREAVNELVPDFNQLASEGLHLSIVNTPESISDSYSKLLTQCILANQKVFDEMVAEYDQLAQALEQPINDISTQSDNLSGSLEEQGNTIANLIQRAQAIQNDIPTTLNDPYEKICKFNLQLKVKQSPADLNGSVEMLLTKLARLSELNKAAIIEEQNKALIDQYNQLAASYNQQVNDFEESVKSIDGDYASKRDALISKQQELLQKREEASKALEEPFHNLEKGGLHLKVETTPSTISSHYAAIFNDITNSLNQCYAQMVSNYDQNTIQIADNIKQINDQLESQAASGDIESFKSAIDNLQSQTQPIQEQLKSLDVPYDELTQFKLNYKAKFSPNDVRSMYEQLVSQLQHKEKSVEAQMTSKANEERINAYNEKASGIINAVKAIDAEIGSVEGSNEERISKLNKKEEQISAKNADVEELSNLYNDLEKNELHLEIENTPSTVQTFISNANSHAESVIQAIHKAIAQEKGLEISQDEINEFRENFNYFDKDQDKALVPFEFVACLTAMGDSITEEEAKQIINKYSPGAAALDFKSYVNFMLDRHSKKETPESTKEAFLSISQNSPVITDQQLAQYFSPEDCEYLKTHMKQVDGGYDFAGYVDSIYG